MLEHQKAEPVNLESIRSSFIQKGYEVGDLTQIWRHVTGRVRKDGEDYFLKLASSPQVSPRTENEAAWNNFINASGDHYLPMAVPRILETGTEGDLFWYTGEFIAGKVLAVVDQPNETTDLEANLPVIAQTAAAIMVLPTEELLPLDTASEGRSLQDQVMERVEKYSEPLEKDVSALKTCIKERLHFVESAPQHGDFVPWGMMQSPDGKLYLIDGEAARIKGVKFYDVAYFYHRVYTKLRRPDIAQRFLQEFITVQPLTEEEKENLRLVISLRLIGGYMDALNDTVTSQELQDELQEKLLTDKII